MDQHTVCVCFAILATQIIATTSGCPKNGYSLTANYTKQLITSPNYPGPYPRPASCKWSLEAYQGDIIVFQFLHFDLEASIFCYKDTLSIIDGHTGFHYELLSMCGSYDKTNVLHKTSEPAAIVQFSSITSGDRNTGFEIRYWTEDILKAEFRDPEYGVVNFILFGLSFVILVLALYVMRLLIRVHVRIKIRYEEEDEDMTQKRIEQCYAGAQEA